MSERPGTAVSIGRLRELLAGYAPALAVVLAVLYAAGFLVVNTYLGEFGVRDLEPLRTRYVAAAIPFLALSAVAAFVGIRVDDTMRRVTRGHRRALFRSVLIALRLPTVAVVVTVVILSALASLRASGLGLVQQDWLRLFDVAVFGIGPVLAVLVFRSRRHDWHTWLGGLLLLASLSSFPLALIAYSRTIYPSIPTWLGGGAADTVQLVVDDVERLCPPCASGPVRLLDEDGSRVVVLLERPDGSRVAVEIARSAVRSITHTPVSAR